MTIQEMKDRETRYQEMVDDLIEGRSPRSFALPSDCFAHLRFGDKMGMLRHAHHLFCEKYGNVEEFGSHQRRGLG